MSDRGQTMIESAMSAVLFTSLVVFAFGFTLNFLALNILTRWAHYNSRCVALIQNTAECESKTRWELHRYFGMRSVQVRTSTFSGVIHSELRSTFIGNKQIVARFDLQPAEYKRVK